MNRLTDRGARTAAVGCAGRTHSLAPTQLGDAGATDRDLRSGVGLPVVERRRRIYLLAVPPTGRGVSDALNRRFPTLYASGADMSTLELEIPNDGDGQPNWRLYRVNDPVPAV